MNQIAASPIPGPENQTTNPRLLSLDALRGFDMFWIIGADSLVAGLRKISDTGAIKFVADQLEHEAWEGLRFEDLIFPLFVFIVGISVALSLPRTIQQSGRNAAVRRIFRRAILLYLLGVLYYGGFATAFADIRLLGVLQRIALCYFVAALLFCYLKPQGLVAICAGLLLGYWALMTFVPVPGVGSGNFGEGKNLANYVDKQYLPLRKWDGDHDPEGLLSTLPAIATCLLGVFAGLLLKNKGVSDQKKVIYLAGAGMAGVALGWLWGLQFPVIKKIWTSSFVLVTGGYGAMLLAFFYQVVDIWKYQKWAQPFVWIGVNPITIYMAVNLIDFGAIARRLVGGQLNSYFGVYGQLVVAVASLVLELWFLNFLYRRKIFLRV
ncbi:MAG TPA: heparan-alpha-glucosaminide N-acetyltransferase domain-containing protein [Candidatus Binataceae bacterium]|nr:heparan-alpha-glucosaminide N-acetyltransferase domain-containing protein [Candidatus Binataceae bacterium]